MGGALLKAWAANTDHLFTVADPAKPDLPEGVSQVGSVDELGEEVFDYLIVALKPQLIDQVLPAYLPRLSASGVISSIAAGYSAEKLERPLCPWRCFRNCVQRNRAARFMFRRNRLGRQRGHA